MEEKIRAFISIEIPIDAVNEIKKIQENIKGKFSFNGKFTEFENLHLTLKFLGEIPEDKMEKVKEILREIKIQEFNAHLGELGLFSEKVPRILWIELKGADKLQKELDMKLGDIFEKEHRFMGHITIARIKYIKEKEELLKYLRNLKSVINFSVNKFYLKKSELRDKGPIYTSIGEYLLGKEK